VIKEYAKLYAEETGKILTDEEGMALWADEEKRNEVLGQLEDPKKYERVLNGAMELSQEFEKASLQSMYQNVSNSIREADTTHILFLEHAYFMNTGISSAIEPVKRKDGITDPLVGYDAHGYDLLVDTKYYGNQGIGRTELIFTKINETSKRINVPVLVGEWGALSGPETVMNSVARYIIGVFEKFGLSNTYWAYHTGIENNSYFNDAIIRPYPPYIGGTLLKYSFSHNTGLFSCSWEESPEINAPTVIYIPDIENLERESISLNPERSSTIIQTIKNSKAGYLIIPVTGKSVTRNIEFKINNNQDSFSIEEKNSK
jgi:endoglycosylceramidase